MQVGLDNVASGDTLYILAGEYNGDYVLENKAFTANVTIRAYPNNVVYITSYNKSYATSSNSRWTSLGSGVWKTKFSTSEIINPKVYYKDGTKFFTWANKANFLNSKYTENTWYDSSAQELYVKFSDTSKNPNTIALYTSNYKRPMIIRKNSISSSAYIIIRGLNFKYNSNHLLIDDQSNGIVQDCSFDGGHFAIAVSNHDTPGRTNIIIRNNVFNGRANPEWYIEDMKNEGTEETSAIYVTNHKGRVLIYDNSFSYWSGGVLLGTNEPDECNNSRVYNNKFTYGRGSQIEIENYCSNTKYYNNKIFDNDYAGVSFAPADASAGGCEFYNNIIVAKNNQQWSESYLIPNYAIKAQSIYEHNIKNWYIHHNTFYGYGRALNTIDKSSSGISEGAWMDTTWRDNIFYAETEYTLFRTGLASDGVFYDYNLYYLSDGWNLLERWNTNSEAGFASLVEAKASSYWDGKWDIHSKQADPLFTNLAGNDVTPKYGSPACTMSSTGSYVGALPCAVPNINIAPTQSTPLLRASDYPDNTSNADLTCYNQSTYDANGDKVINIIQWYRNSVLRSYLTNRSTISASYTSPGQRWVCQVTPFDGKAYGISRNSSSLLILSPPVCGDNICNGNENCSSCSGDCGACPVQNTAITACTLPDVSWNEDDILKNAYDLNACFKDPLKTTLSFRASGNQNITVAIKNGIVDLSAITDWNGFERVRFIASSGSRTAYTNRATLTVLPTPDCGDENCDSNENCSSCSSDCGTCPAPTTTASKGGGGGGSSIPTTFEWVCGEWSECINGEQTQLCTDASREVQRTNTKACDSPTASEDEPAHVDELTAGGASSDGNDYFITTGEDETTGNVALQSASSDAVTTNQEAEKTNMGMEEATGMAVKTSSIKTGGLLIAGILVIIAIIGVMVIQFRKRHDSVNVIDDNPEPVDYVKLLGDYVEEAAGKGFSREDVKNSLVNIGWSDDVIEALLVRSNAEFLPAANETKRINNA